MTVTHHGSSSVAGGRRFAQKLLNPWVSRKTWSTRPSIDLCTSGQLLPMLRFLYWHFHTRPTPTRPCCSISQVLWGAGVGLALDLACLRHGLRDSPKSEPPQMPPQAISPLVPRTGRYQRPVLTLHQEQKHPSALQGKDCQLHLVWKALMA